MKEETSQNLQKPLAITKENTINKHNPQVTEPLEKHNSIVTVGGSAGI